MNIIDLTPGQLKRAATIKERIDALNKELDNLLGRLSTSAPRKKTGSMTDAVKKKIAAAQRVRWAKIKRR